MALLDHQLLCLITDLVQLDQLEDLEVQALGMAVQDTDLGMDQEHLQLLAMVLHKALAMANLINSSSIILPRYFTSYFTCSNGTNICIISSQGQQSPPAPAQQEAQQ